MARVRGCWLMTMMTILVLPACNESGHEKHSSVTAAQVSASEWRALETKRVVFGHQSLGGNILRGVRQLAARDGIKLDINRQRTASAVKGISHFAIGKNGDPAYKIRDFAAAVDAGAAQGADVAMMKLCFEDVTASTDAKQLADDYIASLEALAQRHPSTSFVAVTVPLMAIQTGPKAWIKRLLGRQPNGYADNAKRAEFNKQLRDRYLAGGRLFDIAQVEAESTGQSCTAPVDGQAVQALCPELTNDGGHLNGRGQELAGAAFLRFVSALPVKQVTK
jgi:hypothetical protein